METFIYIWGLRRNKVAPMPGGFCSPIRTGWVWLGDHHRVVSHFLHIIFCERSNRKKHWGIVVSLGLPAVLYDINWTSCKGLEFQRAHDFATPERDGRITFPVRPNLYYLYVHMQDLLHADRWRSRTNPALQRKTYTAHTKRAAPLSVTEWVWMADGWRTWVTTLVMPC